MVVQLLDCSGSRILMEVLFESEGVKRMKCQRVDRSSIENSLRKALAS